MDDMSISLADLACHAMSPHPHDEGEEESSGRKRRKIGWTNTEDLTILAAVRRIGTQWQRIADNLPGRTADAVRNRWHRLQKTHALNDTEEGRSALDGLLVASGVDPDWCPPELMEKDAVAGVAVPEPCIRGSDHGRHMWSREEDQIIEDGVKRLGCKWRQVRARAGAHALCSRPRSQRAPARPATPCPRRLTHPVPRSSRADCGLAAKPHRLLGAQPVDAAVQGGADDPRLAAALVR